MDWGIGNRDWGFTDSGLGRTGRHVNPSLLHLRLFEGIGVGGSRYRLGRRKAI